MTRIWVSEVRQQRTQVSETILVFSEEQSTTLEKPRLNRTEPRVYIDPGYLKEEIVTLLRDDTGSIYLEDGHPDKVRRSFNPLEVK